MPEGIKSRAPSAAALRFDSVEPGLAVPAVFWTTDARLRITSLNGNGLDVLGLPVEDILGRSVPETLASHNIDDPILNAHWRALAGESLCFEVRLGNILVEIYVAPLRGVDEVVNGTVGVAKVARNSAQASGAKIEEGERYRALVDKSSDVIVLTNEKGIVLHASQTIERVLGYTPEEFVGQSGFGFVHPEDGPAARELFQDILSSGGKSLTDEFRVRAKDRTWKQVEATVTNMLEDASVCGVVVNFRDITERRRVEAERQVMLEIIHQLSSTSNLDEFLGRMHGALKTVICAENCFVALHNNETGMFHFPFVKDLHDIAPPPQTAGRTCSAYVFRTGKPLLARRNAFADLVASGEIEMVGTPSASWLGVPLVTSAGSLGVLVVQSYDDENAYSDRDVELLMSVGAQIALAIERKRAEEELRKREEEHTIIFNSAPAIIVCKDRESRILRANRAAAEFFGISPGELQGRHVSELWPDPEGTSEKEDLEVMETGMARAGTVNFWRGASGDARTIHTQRVPYRDHDGKVAGIIVFATDITEQRKSRELLESVRRQNELILQSAGEGICSVDRDSRCTMVNPAVTTMTQWSREDLLGKNIRATVLHSQPNGKPYSIDQCPLAAMYQDGIPRRVADEVLWRKDGTCFPVEYCATPIREKDAIVGAVITFRDMTEQHRARQILRESESRYRLLVENAAYGIFRTSPDGRFLDVNNALTMMLGYASNEELCAVNIRDAIYIRPEERDPMIAETLARGSMDGGELEWKRKDGSAVMVRLSARVVRPPEGEVYFEGIVENVTERRALETQLRQAQKMEAVGRLAGGVAHDFNNLLMVIKGHSELLLERTTPEHPDYRKVEQIKKAADRAAGLTRQLLAFSRMQVMQPRAMDLNATVIEMGKMLPRLIGEDIELAILTKPDLGSVKADAGQMEQILLNLAVNARDAMPGGGKLLMETSNVALDEHYARTHPPLMPGRYVMLAVSDTGTGMDEATKAHIFEPFFTTKEKGKGTGLGLATVYGVVKQSGGYIWVYSEKGKGTTFKIYLPRVDELAEVDRDKRRREELPRGAGTVLLAEDEKEVRALAREFLELSGYTVIEAKDGAEAIHLAKMHAGAIDLLLTDMVMPGMSGRELAAALVVTRPQMKIIFMSGYTEYAVQRHEGNELASIFLQKPFTRALLASSVHKALGGKPL